MKKLFLLFTAVAAMSVSAQAQEVKTGVLEVGDYTNNGSYFDMAPTNFYVDHFASQMMYLYDTDFAEFAGKQNVKITKIYYKFNDQAVYSDINADVNYCLQLVDANAFQIDADGDKVYFDFGEPAVTGEFYYEAFSAYGEDVEVVIDLTDAPFAVTPGLTSDCMASSDDAAFYTSGIRNRVMTYSDNYDSFLDYVNSSTYPKCSPTYSGGSTNSDLPVTRIEYTYTEGGTTELRGDVNLSNDVTIADVTALIDYLLSGDSSSISLVNANCNQDSDVTIADVTALIDYLLSGAW